MEDECISTRRPRPWESCTAWRGGGEGPTELELLTRFITHPEGKKGNAVHAHTHELLSLAALEKRGKIHADFPCRITAGTISSALGLEQNFFTRVEPMGHRPYQVPFEGIALH